VAQNDSAKCIVSEVLGLLAAVSRIAAILPNDLAPTNMNGPLRTFTAPSWCCSAARYCGLSPQPRNRV